MIAREELVRDCQDIGGEISVNNPEEVEVYFKDKPMVPLQIFGIADKYTNWTVWADWDKPSNGVLFTRVRPKSHIAPR